MRLLLALAALFVVVLTPGAPARAQQAPAPGWEEWRALGEGVVAMRAGPAAATGEGARRIKVTVGRLDARLAAAGEPIAVYEGLRVDTALAVRAGAAAVVLFRGGAQPFVKVAVVDLATRVARVVDLDRTAGAGYEPTVAVACADADGFTVLWQEEKTGDRSAEARSAFARVKADGTVLARPAAVAVPWSLGALVDDGRGYTLAVNFDGAAPDQTRLCFVTLDRAGKPEQHPWWGARPGLVGDVQLVSAGGKVTAVYRSGNALLAVVADGTTGQWAKEAGPSRTLGTGLGNGAPFAARAAAPTGADVAVVKR